MQIAKLVAWAPVALVALGVFSGGCLTEPCSAGVERWVECGLVAPDQSLDVLQECHTHPRWGPCVFGCSADATCDELTASWGREGCGGQTNDFQRCVESCSPSGGCETPVVLAFDGGAIAFGAEQELDLGRGVQRYDAPTPATPWLALDRDRDGVIDAGDLFGSATVLAGDRLARNGFEALAELDADGDDRITERDPAFAWLVLWRDLDGDGKSTAAELQPLGAAGIVAIDLGYASGSRCDERGNCERERAGFTWLDVNGVEHRGAAVDVHLRARARP